MFDALKKTTNKSRWFYLQYIIYLLMIVGSTIWAYVRLDFVRSYEKRQSQAIEQYQHDKETRLPEPRRVHQ